MSFCPKCGTPLPQGGMFCPKCGTAIAVQNHNVANQTQQAYVNTPQPVQYTENTVVPQQNAGNKFDIKKPLFSIGKFKVNLLKILIAAFSLVLVIILAVVLIGGGKAPQSIVDDAISAMQDYDFYAVADLAHEDVIYAIADKKGKSVNEYLSDIQDRYNDRRQKILENLDSYDISWEIVDVRQAGYDDFDEYSDDYRDYRHDLIVQDVQVVKVKFYEERVEDGVPEFDTDTEEFYAIKVDGDWYIDIFEYD